MKRYLALFALLLLPMLAWGQGNTVTLSGSGAPAGGCAFIMRYIDVVGQVEYACDTSGNWFQVGPGAAGATSLSSVTNPTGNKAFDMQTFSLTWNWATGNTSTTNLFSVADNATNTGTGYLFTVSSGSGSTTKPFRVCYRGTSNCINMDTTTLTTSGTVVIDATKLSGNLPALNGASLTNVDAATLQTHAASYFQQALTLTTTGTSGAATLVGGTLNIPQYTGGGGISNSAPNLHLMESDGTNAIDSGVVRSTNDYTFPGAVIATTSVGAGTAPTACGSATGCFGATANTTASTQTAGQGSIRLDTSSGWVLRGVNGASEAAILFAGGALGTPASGTLTNATGLPAAGVVAGALANGMTATTQTDSDNSTKLATTAYVDTHAVLPTKIPAVTVTVTTSTPVTVSTTLNAAFYMNEHATAGTAITYNLPTAAAGKQFCFSNAYNGSAANTGALTLATSAAGQYIIYKDGTLSASGGNVASGGAAGDAACVVGVDSTHWMYYEQRGTWTKN